jgi:MYXO-CTERM domain-containing protein
MSPWIFLLFWMSEAAAQPHVDGTIEAHIERGLPPDWLAGRRAPSPGSAAVLVVLEQPATPRDLERLEALGVSIERVENRALVYGRLVSATVDRPALERLRSARFVSQVLRAPPSSRPPLDRSRALLGLPGHGIENAARERLTGAGTVIADIDTLADVFHPDFFFADAGWYSWIDVDGDGAFTLDADAIDLDADGVADENEIGRGIRSTPLDVETGGEAPVRSREFEPAIDWIYADENGNGARDTAPGGGFTDATPAFGEPLFVPDDVDGDGLLEPAERLVRLGTSKLRKVFLDIDGVAPRRVFERGVDLSSVRQDYTGGIYGFADGLHGSGVLGIAAGGVPLPSRRLVGVAPDAELLLAWSLSNDVTAGAMWALGESPHVMIHEAAVWTGFPLDGSDAWSAVVGEAAGNGVAHACPVGNIGGARKHAVLPLPAEGTAAFPLDVPGSTRMVTLTLQVRGATTLTARIVTPSGLSRDVDLSEPFAMLDEASFYAVEFTRTLRDTAVLTLTIWDGERFTTPLPDGVYRFELDGDGTDRVAHAFVSDSESGFDLWAGFDPAIATDASTLAMPSIADDCLRVGSIPSHPISEGTFYRGGAEPEGVVRLYSARGPRIDGDHGPHVVAPDNPWAPAPAGDLFPTVPGRVLVDPGSYMVFGGTSGAGPHAAGVLALLAQGGIHGRDAHRAIRDGANTDGLEVPNEDYGDGRLDAAGALGVAIEGAGPTISLSASAAVAGDAVRVTATVADPDGGALEVRWDDGYDGSWDSGYTRSLERDTLQIESGARIKARVRDPEGHVAEASILVPVLPSAPDAGVPDAGAPDGGSTPAEDDGCDCSTTPRSSPFVFFAAVLAWLVRRARPRR